MIKDPVRRPTIYEVVDHKWFDQETKKQIDRFEWRPNFIPTLDDLGDCRSGISRTRPGTVRVTGGRIKIKLNSVNVIWIIPVKDIMMHLIITYWNGS